MQVWWIKDTVSNNLDSGPAPNSLTCSKYYNLIQQLKLMADRFRTVSMPVHRVFIVNMLLAFAFHLHSAFALPFSVHLPLTKLCSMFTDRSPCICLPSTGIQLFICSPFKWKSKKVPVKCLLPPELFKKILTHWCVIISDYFFTGTWTSFTFFQAMII